LTVSQLLHRVIANPVFFAAVCTQPQAISDPYSIATLLKKATRTDHFLSCESRGLFWPMHLLLLRLLDTIGLAWQ
jgi:hypothetical protein